MVVGVGIGGTFDKCALLAKKALMRPIDSENPDPFYADLEKEMLEKVNKLGIGPQGFGGKTTAIGSISRQCDSYCGNAVCSQHQLPCYPS